MALATERAQGLMTLTSASSRQLRAATKNTMREGKRQRAPKEHMSKTFAAQAGKRRAIGGACYDKGVVRQFNANWDVARMAMALGTAHLERKQFLSCRRRVRRVIELD